jgi:hypothetical protein
MLPEVTMQQAQHLELGARSAGVIDPFAGAQRVQPALEFRAATRACASLHSAKSITAVTSMYSTFRNSRLDGLYGLMWRGLCGNSACSGLTPTTPMPRRPQSRTSVARSVKSPMPQLCAERTPYSCRARPQLRRPSVIDAGRWQVSGATASTVVATTRRRRARRRR